MCVLALLGNPSIKKPRNFRFGPKLKDPPPIGVTDLILIDKKIFFGEFSTLGLQIKKMTRFLGGSEDISVSMESSLTKSK